MSYQFTNLVTPQQLQQLQNPVVASSVIEELAAIAEETDPAQTDQVGQWLKLLEANQIVAQRGGANGITVSPGGQGSPDRIAMTVANGIATVTGVSEAAA